MSEKKKRNPKLEVPFHKAEETNRSISPKFIEAFYFSKKRRGRYLQ